MGRPVQRWDTTEFAYEMNISLHAADNAWEVSLIGKNLTNKLVITETYGTPFLGGGFGKAGPILLPTWMEP